MALRKLENGQYELKTKKDLAQACELRSDLMDSLEEMEIHDIQNDITEIQRGIGRFMNQKGIERFDFDHGNTSWYARLILRKTPKWIGLKSEIPNDAPPTTKALKDVLTREQWMAVTRRVVDEKKLDEAVRAGEIDEDDIKDCLIEISQQPFAQFYRDVT